jgi:hypothetical protein
VQSAVVGAVGSAQAGWLRDLLAASDDGESFSTSCAAGGTISRTIAVSSRYTNAQDGSLAAADVTTRDETHFADCISNGVLLVGDGIDVSIRHEEFMPHISADHVEQREQLTFGFEGVQGRLSSEVALDLSSGANPYVVQRCDQVWEYPIGTVMEVPGACSLLP